MDWMGACPVHFYFHTISIGMLKVINETTLKFKLYEAALESGLTSSQYHTLMAEGVLDWVKDALASVSGGKALAGKLGAMFKDEKNKALYAKATESIRKNVEDLFKAGAAAGVDKAALKDWLIAGVNKMTETAASQAPTSKSDDVAQVGKPLSPNKPEAVVPVLATAAAQAIGQDPEKAKEQAQEKSVDVPKATQVLANAVAKQAKADSGLAAKVIDWLLKNNHLVAESGGKITDDYLRNVVKGSLQKSELRRENKILVERWNKLAGILSEENEKSDAKKKKFSDFLDSLQKALGIEGEKDAKAADSLMNILIVLDDLESVEVK